MPIVLAGTNHKTSPLWLREKAALAGISLFDARKRVHSLPGIAELVVVSTCNRVEFYVAGPQASECRQRLTEFLIAEYGLKPEEAEEFFYFAEGRDAVRHLFQVVVGADSMVIGETQVTGQVHRSFEQAKNEGTVGPELSRLFPASQEVAKKMRAETELCRQPISIGSVAVTMARDKLGTLKNRSAMVLGAGDMGILTARALSANGIASILVANRTIGRAQEVAHKLGGRTVDYSELSAQIEKVDVLVTSTSAPHILIKRAMLEGTMKARNHQPLFIIDLAVPRNVDPSAGEIPGLTLVNVDDLQTAAQNNTQERLAELCRVNAIIGEEAELFMNENQVRKMSLIDLAL